MGKKRMVALIIIGIMIVVLTIGGTYAYFSAVVKGNAENKNAEVSTGTLSLKFSDKTGNINASEISPGWTKEKTVTVENTGTLPVTYDLVWLNLDNEIIKEELVYTITCTNNCTGLTESAVPEAGENLEIIKGQTIKSKEIQTYTITFQLKETSKNQDYNQGLTIEGTIGIKESGSYEEKDRSIVREGLELLYNKRSLENASDTLIDKSGKRHNGKVVGATKTSEGLSFDGGNNGVIIGKLNYDYVTLETEFEFDAPRIVGFVISNVQAGYAGYGISVNTDFAGGGIFGEGYAEFQQIVKGYDFIKGKYHVVETCDGINIKIYVNGKLKEQKILSGPIASSANYLALGCLSVDGKNCTTLAFIGTISNVKVYSRALTADEVLKNYNALQN